MDRTILLKLPQEMYDEVAHVTAKLNLPKKALIGHILPAKKYTPGDVMRSLIEYALMNMEE